MIAISEESAIIRKTRELCQSILDQPEFKAHLRSIDAFRSDQKLLEQYQNVLNQRDHLQQKQQSGMRLTDEEVNTFEQLKDHLLQQPIVRQFHEAEEALQQVHSSVNQYVELTIKLGRLPAAEELATGHCGHGCGCHH